MESSLEVGRDEPLAHSTISRAFNYFTVCLISDDPLNSIITIICISKAATPLASGQRYGNETHDLLTALVPPRMLLNILSYLLIGPLGAANCVCRAWATSISTDEGDKGVADAGEAAVKRGVCVLHHDDVLPIVGKPGDAAGRRRLRERVEGARLDEANPGGVRHAGESWVGGARGLRENAHALGSFCRHKTAWCCVFWCHDLIRIDQF